LWTSEIHINLKIYEDDLKRNRCKISFRPTTYRIYQRQRRKYAGKCAWIYVICSV